MTLLLVALGGLLGVLARYGLGSAVPVDALPWVTVGINAVGSFLLGALIPLGHFLPPEVRVGLAVGFLGGFTTYATFSADVFFDIETGHPREALVYLVASLVLGIGGAALGYFAARTVTS